MAYQYKNDSPYDLTVMGVGVVKAGEIVEVEEPLENPNFSLVSGGEQTQTVAPAVEPTPQPMQVVDTQSNQMEGVN